VAAFLGMTEDEQKAARAIVDTYRPEEENQRALKSISHVRQGRLASPQPLEEAGRDASRVADERLLALLTPEQRERFEEMKRGTP
jgi:hypothetical protein